MNFGDNVKIKSNDITQKLDLAGKTGQIYGETTPSVTGVEIIGAGENDYALSVYFEDSNEQLWFSADLLEFIDHAPGTTMSLGIGKNKKKWVRNAQGEWIEIRNKPWWKLW
ncbi:hypothetical protein [Leptospira koniambonensis]|uniref:hypothetical protein n=1 Tax=Leptospira koniambonensis TaxID=2484950 RepID=UPI003EBDDBFC